MKLQWHIGLYLIKGSVWIYNVLMILPFVRTRKVCWPYSRQTAAPKKENNILSTFFTTPCIVMQVVQQTHNLTTYVHLETFIFEHLWTFQKNGKNVHKIIQWKLVKYLAYRKKKKETEKTKKHKRAFSESKLESSNNAHQCCNFVFGGTAKCY